MGRQQEHDWFRAELAYISAFKPLTLKDIAHEFDIPYQSVRRYASKFHWQLKRAHFYCVTRHLTKFKTLEKMYGLTINDILKDNPHNETFSDLAYCFCRDLEIKQDE